MLLSVKIHVNTLVIPVMKLCGIRGIEIQKGYNYKNINQNYYQVMIIPLTKFLKKKEDICVTTCKNEAKVKKF